MTDFLLKLFVKDYKNTGNQKVRTAYGTFAGFVGIITNVLIAVAKLIIGFLSQSIAAIADAANNFSDAGSSLITLIGFKLSGKPADKEHPYGHARLEYVTGLIVSIVVFSLGAIFLMDSVKKIISGEKSYYEWYMIIILGVAVLVKLWQCLFYSRIAKKIDSELLRASSADSRNDCIMTAVVLIGAIVTRIFDVAIDGWLGAGVAIFILISGIKLIIDTANPLIGTAPDKELIDKLKGKIMSYPNVIGTHDMIIHSYGANRIFCSVHVEVPANESVLACHDVIDNIEKDVFEEFGVFLVIHTDPVSVGDERIDGMKEYLSGILPENCKFHDFRVVFGTTHDNVIFDIVIPFEKGFDIDKTKSDIADKFRQKYPKANLVITVDNDYT